MPLKVIIIILIVYATCTALAPSRTEAFGEVGQIVSGENGVGLAFQSCFVLVHGCFSSSLLAKGIREIVMRIRVVRSQFECLSVMNDRLLDVAFLTERRADAVMALGVIEWKRERLLVLGDGGIDLAILQKRVA